MIPGTLCIRFFCFTFDTGIDGTVIDRLSNPASNYRVSYIRPISIKGNYTVSGNAGSNAV